MTALGDRLRIVEGHQGSPRRTPDRTRSRDVVQRGVQCGVEKGECWGQYEKGRVTITRWLRGSYSQPTELSALPVDYVDCSPWFVYTLQSSPSLVLAVWQKHCNTLFKNFHLHSSL